VRKRERERERESKSTRHEKRAACKELQAQKEDQHKRQK
jgi:hypothetical protein